MLSKDIATEFRGRGSCRSMYIHFLFSEYNQAMGGDRRDNFEQYLIYGGMPYLLNLHSIRQKQDYLQSLFREVYIKDIIEYNGIERQDILDDMLDFFQLLRRFADQCNENRQLAE